jgi:hypothetical protein
VKTLRRGKHSIRKFNAETQRRQRHAEEGKKIGARRWDEEEIKIRITSKRRREYTDPLWRS